MNKSTTFISRALVVLLIAGISLTGCYDDSGLYEKMGDLSGLLQDHESRLKELEVLCNRQNTNIESLQTIVAALQDKDYVTNVAPITEGKKIVGYTITFSKSGSITIYNGEDGYVPSLGVKQHSDGQWYWTIDGQWLTDADGDKVRASAIDGQDGTPGAPGEPGESGTPGEQGKPGTDGITPRLKIVDGYWYISYDDGVTWESEPLGQATGEKGDKGDQGPQGQKGEKGDSMFSSVAYDDHSVTMTLSDGTVLIVPRSDSNTLPLSLTVSHHTATTAVFSGTVDLDKMGGYSWFGFAWSLDEDVTIDDRDYIIERLVDGNEFTQEVTGLPHGTTIYYALYVSRAGICIFDEVHSFKTDEVTIGIDGISVEGYTATVTGKVNRQDVDSEVHVGIEVSSDMSFRNTILHFLDGNAISSDGSYSLTIDLYSGLNYYRTVTKQFNGRTGEYIWKYGDMQIYDTGRTYDTQTDLDIASAIDLSSFGSANCHIVSGPGLYKFRAVKGNSSTSAGDVTSAAILWETFGTSTSPNMFDLINAFCYKDGYIVFQTADTFKEGNAVIAAKDASGEILWSWHIWFTDAPKGQEYYNNAGTMMDRNLGATSATPGDVGALGLLYQWGRKDPFLGSSSISIGVEAKSTISNTNELPESSSGNINFTITHPTTFVNNWCYDKNYSEKEMLWPTSDHDKSLYDPCPIGWRVPDNDVWTQALGSPTGGTGNYDTDNKGMNFSGRFGSYNTIWYPAAGCRSASSGLIDVDEKGGYWAAGIYTDDESLSNCGNLLGFDRGNDIHGLTLRNGCSFGHPVRCIRENSQTSEPIKPDDFIQTLEGNANCYIVSAAGSYKFRTVKGNSSTSVGSVSSAEVLWESLGTDITPSVGGIVKNAVYSDGYITFQTANTFKEGNTVIAAKDASGEILWSWHIWFTDAPKGQEYYNNAGTMMDRNLGATSATPGDVGALGLLYQWGRKDPFLGSSSISSSTLARSTGTWPSVVESNSSTGTMKYATSHPTTFITGNDSNKDWYYTGNESTDNTRWTTSETSKSIYDPCPVGWRVPDGGSNGVWSKAKIKTGQSLSYDDTNEGINFSGMFGSASTIWYPASGFRSPSGGDLDNVGFGGYYWSASPHDYHAFFLSFNNVGGHNLSNNNRMRAFGQPVRCHRE